MRIYALLTCSSYFRESFDSHLPSVVEYQYKNLNPTFYMPFPNKEKHYLQNLQKYLVFKFLEISFEANQWIFSKSACFPGENTRLCH